MVYGARFAAIAGQPVLMVVDPGQGVLYALSRALAVALGLGARATTAAAVFTAIKIAGALYLVYLGVQAFRHRRKLTDAMAARVPAKPGRVPAVLRDGFVVGFVFL